MSVILAAAIGGAAGNAVLLVAGVVYIRWQHSARRKRHRETLDRIEAKQLASSNNKVEIRIPGGDAEFREWLRKSIRLQGGPPTEGDAK